MRTLMLSLGIALAASVMITGCDLGIHDLDLSGMFGDPYYPPDADDIGHVWLSISADTLIYPQGTEPEVTGYLTVYNVFSDPLPGARVEYCISDDRVSLVEAETQDTTGTDGRVNFTLRGTNCAGDVNFWMRAYDASNQNRADGRTIVYLQEDRRPAFLLFTAAPETLYADYQHPDSALIVIMPYDAQNRPIPAFNVRSSLFIDHNYPAGSDCTYGIVPTDSDGKITTFFHSYDYGRCVSVYAGALGDTVCITVLPWDSTHGGQ